MFISSHDSPTALAHVCCAQLPELQPPEVEETETFKFPETEKISPPVLQLNEASFGYTPDKILLKDINIDVGLDSRIAVVGPNGAGKSTLCVLFYAGHLATTDRQFLCLASSS